MQLSFRQKEQLFHELAQFSRSGIPLRAALENIGRDSASAIGRCARRVQAAWEATGSAAQAFQQAGFAARDASILEAGENSGRLDEVFAGLSDYYAQLAVARHAFIKRSLYPLFLFHFALLALALPVVVSKGFGPFLITIIPLLLGFYLLLAFVFFAAFFAVRASVTNPLAARLLAALPVVGKFFEDWTAWNFSLVLSLYIKAGGGLLKAFTAAAKSSGNAVMEQRSLEAVSQVRDHGTTLSDPFRQLRAVPSPLLRAIEIGEQSGRLDEEATRAAASYRTTVLQKLEIFSEWLPRALYVIVLIFVAWQIVAEFTGMASALNGALNPES